MRNTLNQGQRKQLIEEYLRRSSAGEPASQNALAEWAAQTFNFPQKPSQATISRLLKNRITISKSRVPDNAKRATVPRQPALEDALFSWIVDQKFRNGRVTSGTVREFGRHLLRQVNEKLPTNKNLEFRFSNGWMEKYKKRYGLKFWRLSEDHDEQDERNVFEEGYPAFVRKLATYNDEDIWSAAEFGVQYCMNPNASISTALGHEDSKLTIIVCSNKTGSEKFPLTIIGNDSANIALDEETMREADFEYIPNVRAWVTAKLFFSWLHSFDAYIGRNRDRKVLLVLDSCSAHGTSETVPALKNTELLFLPQGSIAKTLPMECGIISTMKLRFKRQQLFSVLDRVDESAADVFHVNPHVAMRWLSHEWKVMSPNVIQSCWQQSLGNIDPDRHQFLVETTREEAYEINELFNEVARVCGLSNIRSLLYSPNESDCIERVTLETLRDTVVERLLASKVGNQNVITPHVPHLPPVKEQLKALAIVRLILDERAMTASQLRKVIRDVQRDIRTEHAAKQNRTPQTGTAIRCKEEQQAQQVQQPEQHQSTQQNQQAEHYQQPDQVHAIRQVHSVSTGHAEPNHKGPNQSPTAAWPPFSKPSETSTQMEIAIHSDQVKSPVEFGASNTRHTDAQEERADGQMSITQAPDLMNIVREGSPIRGDEATSETDPVPASAQEQDTDGHAEGQAADGTVPGADAPHAEEPSQPIADAQITRGTSQTEPDIDRSEMEDVEHPISFQEETKETTDATEAPP
ncbi:CENP-B-like [Gracilariopsis chorda]|uniref:CENP-B-like n=1 Tax=Gracilariopsis chorda TaxID=448386 RepID=A0A2V3ITN6_9FLOR|nr:CENP-B-like [Gracilariopsis chorda]|eukprot:PXF45462.1 CENP-B-like [Gracilariopsis chorda]